VISVVLIRRCPSSRRSTPSPVDRRVRRHQTTNSNSICIPIIVTLDVDRSDVVLLSDVRVSASRFYPSSTLCRFDSYSLLSFCPSLSLSLSLSLYFSTLCHFISVSRRFAPFYRCRRIITQKSEFHFVLIERSAQRCAARERRVATFPSLDAQVSHDSSRVSGYSERNVSEQFQTTRRRGDEGVGNGRVALSP